MKHIFISSILLFASMALHAQGIYTKVTKYDKFDDVVWEKNVKTLIEKNDSIIVVETKGQKPEEYMLLNSELLSVQTGSRDNLVNLVADVYGFQSEYLCVPPSYKEEIMGKIQKMVEESPNKEYDDEKVQRMIVDDLMKRVTEFPRVTFRTISRYSYSFEYDTDMVWVRYKDGSRIIYTK